MTDSRNSRKTYGTIGIQTHPDALLDSFYEEREINMRKFMLPDGRWKWHGETGKKGADCSSKNASLRITCLGSSIMRLQAAPEGKKIPLRSLTERLGLLDTGGFSREICRTETHKEILKARGGGFVFEIKKKTGDFAIQAGGRKLLETVEGGIRFSSERPEYGGDRSFAKFCLESGEKIWGFGGRVMPLERRGSSVDIFSVKVGLKAGDYGGFPMPFFISSRGYGIFLNNPWPHVYFDMGKTYKDNWFAATPGGELDLFVIFGPEIRNIVRNFTAMTGRIPAPDKNLFGFWASSLAFDTAKCLLEIAERLRNEQYPCDNLVLDGPWRAGPEFSTQYRKLHEYSSNDLEWHPDFGNGKEMIRELHSKGFKIALHLNSRIFKQETAKEAIEAGLLRPHQDEIVPELGSKKGENFFLEKLAPRIEEGTDIWWTDHSDRVSGEIRPGVPSRNLFGPLWNRLILKAMAEHGKKGSLCLSRGGGIGSQRSALPWPGDTASGLERFAEDIWFCLNAGLAGFPVTSVDMGGFTPTGTSMSAGEERKITFGKENLHRRLFQSIFFIPAPRIHNHSRTLPRLPWNCPEESRKLYRNFLEERYKLIPYFYSLGIEASLTGEPILRPLFYCFQEDPETYNIDDVFMIGESILTAPVLEKGAVKRRFYLPKGFWYDYWSGSPLAGGKEVEKPCPIDKLSGLPVLIRGGGIIPQQEVVSFLEPEPPEKLHLILYPDQKGNASLVLHEGKNLRHDFSLRRTSGDSFVLSLPNKTKSKRIYYVSAGTGEFRLAKAGPSTTAVEEKKDQIKCAAPAGETTILRLRRL
jgi:alpha-glucosidase